MESKKQCPWNLVIVICLIFFAAGAAAGITYITMKANNDVQKELDLIWTEIGYLHERDLQQEESFQYLRGALRDLELWVVEDQARQDEFIDENANEIERLRLRDESHDSSISGLWTNYYELEGRIRCLECQECSNSTSCSCAYDRYDPYYCPYCCCP